TVDPAVPPALPFFVVDATGTQVGASAGAPIAVFLPPGEARIAVTHEDFNTSIPYKLRTQPFPLNAISGCGAADPDEPNETFDAPTPLLPGVHSGLLCPGDHDFFAVDGPATFAVDRVGLSVTPRSATTGRAIAAAELADGSKYVSAGTPFVVDVESAVGRDD